MELEQFFMTACLGFGGLLAAWILMVGKLGARVLTGIAGSLLGALVIRPLRPPLTDVLERFGAFSTDLFPEGREQEEQRERDAL